MTSLSERVRDRRLDAAPTRAQTIAFGASGFPTQLMAQTFSAFVVYFYVSHLAVPAGWVAVTADTVLAGISPQSAVRAARSADAPIGATPRVRLITLTSAGADAAALSGVYWLIVTDDVRPTMEIPAGDSLDVIRAYVLVDQGGAVVLAVERGFSSADPTLPPD